MNYNLVESPVKLTACNMEDILLPFCLEGSFHLEATFQPFQTQFTKTNLNLSV